MARKLWNDTGNIVFSALLLEDAVLYRRQYSFFFTSSRVHQKFGEILLGLLFGNNQRDVLVQYFMVLANDGLSFLFLFVWYLQSLLILIKNLRLCEDNNNNYP